MAYLGHLCLPDWERPRLPRMERFKLRPPNIAFSMPRLPVFAQFLAFPKIHFPALARFRSSPARPAAGTDAAAATATTTTTTTVSYPIDVEAQDISLPPNYDDLDKPRPLDGKNGHRYMMIAALVAVGIVVLVTIALGLAGASLENTKSKR
jgi:hypothetical protein